VIALILVSFGILVAAGLTVLALREREWGLAIFMGLITLVSLAAAYVAFGCLGSTCLFDGSASSRLEQLRQPEDGNA
jgi:hypothetical protein